MDCLFCKIVNEEIPANKVYEDENVLAFLDTNPIADGHTMVIPKIHVEEFFQLDEQNYSHLMDVVKRVASVIKNAYNPPRVGVIVYGLHVAHAHIHLYPNTGNEIFMHQDRKYSEEKLKQEAQKLQKLFKQ